jgi:hypothetical protein
LFLNPAGSAPNMWFKTADIWFGIQPAYPTLIQSLKRVANE